MVPVSNIGTVLVPSSSSMNFDMDYSFHQSYNLPGDHDVAMIPGPGNSNPWGHPNRPVGEDALSAPSGFLTHNGSLHVSSGHIWGDEARHVEEIDEEGPPRKRISRGSSTDPLDVFDSPGSPDIQRPGQRRRLVGNNTSIVTSSDESMPDVGDILPGPSKPRIIRGRRPGPDVLQIPHHSQPEGEDPKFTRFKVTMPIHGPELVKLAWQHACGDVKKATALLSDPTWDPRPTISHSSVETTGRVMELEEASKAHKAAIKEKGKKSMIYANRPVLEAKPGRTLTPSPAKDTIASSSPHTPVVAPARRKRTKKLVLDSEPEMELTDSDDDRHSGPKPGQQNTSDGSRVLEYFNITGPEALQELTGTSFHDGFRHRVCKVLLCPCRVYPRTSQCYHRISAFPVDR